MTYTELTLDFMNNNNIYNFSLILKYNGHNITIKSTNNLFGLLKSIFISPHSKIIYYL